MVSDLRGHPLFWKTRASVRLHAYANAFVRAIKKRGIHLDRQIPSDKAGWQSAQSLKKRQTNKWAGCMCMVIKQITGKQSAPNHTNFHTQSHRRTRTHARTCRLPHTHTWVGHRAECVPLIIPVPPFSKRIACATDDSQSQCCECEAVERLHQGERTVHSHQERCVGVVLSSPLYLPFAFLLYSPHSSSDEFGRTRSPIIEGGSRSVWGVLLVLTTAVAVIELRYRRCGETIWKFAGDG